MMRATASSAEAATAPTRTRRWPTRNYHLAATLASGQAFRWRQRGPTWEGVIGRRWVALEQSKEGITATTAEPVDNWAWLEEYLQNQVVYESILADFPDDPVLRRAVEACWGLRLLRQEPWECLASFLLSSTKQIPQISAIVERLCARYGEPVAVPPGHEPQSAFPRAEMLAQVAESDLRQCRMGFRARSLRLAAQEVAAGRLELAKLTTLPLDQARAELMRLRGIGPKIADCVLLFSLGFDQAFPVDVWIERVLREQYFPRRRPTPARLARFIPAHFGPRAGYAQQYLFHYFRVVKRGANPKFAI